MAKCKESNGFNLYFLTKYRLISAVSLSNATKLIQRLENKDWIIFSCCVSDKVFTLINTPIILITTEKTYGI